METTAVKHLFVGGGGLPLVWGRGLPLVWGEGVTSSFYMLLAFSYEVDYHAAANRQTLISSLKPEYTTFLKIH